MKKLVMISLVSTAALMLFAQPASADVKDDNTDVGVSFKSDDPTIPGDHKPYKDNLALVWKPNAFEFGSQKPIGGTAVYKGVATGEQYLVVNDDRPLKDGELSSWELTANMSKLKVSGVADDAGINSTIEFKLNNLLNYQITKDGKVNPETNDYDAPNPSKPEGKDSLGAEVTDKNFVLGGAQTEDKLGNKVSLVGGATSDTRIMAKTAATTEKGGYATLVTDKQLSVTSPSIKTVEGKTYAAVVTWSLNDTVQ